MRILADTNVIIDALTSREPWNKSAEDIYNLQTIIGCKKSDLSVNNYYNTLFSWLTSETTSIKNQTSDFLYNLDSFNLDDYTKVIKFNELKVPNIPFYKAKTKHYYGLEEMKKGELNFFKATVLSKSKEDMNKKPEEQKKKDEDKKKKTRCNLEEIPEYVALNESYQALSSQMEALNNELNELREYKNGIELDKKKDLIASFYMLSDEDKQDVNDNIASYSYDDIKSKLSIICVDKRVSFAAPEEQDNKADKKALTYNLDGIQDSSSANKPAWLKSVDNYMKNK